MTIPSPTRRKFLSSAAFAAAAAPAVFSSTRPAAAGGHGRDQFAFEVTRSDAEWEAMLSIEEYIIMRLGGTEQRFTSDLWDEERPGTYHCRGCELPLYDNANKTVLPIGWVFFEHCSPNAVLTGIDEWPAESYGDSGMGEARHVIEAHCRRCGSHLGHILIVMENVLHCINGTSLVFNPELA